MLLHACSLTSWSLTGQMAQTGHFALGLLPMVLKLCMLLWLSVYSCSFITNSAPTHVPLLRVTNDHAMKALFGRPVHDVIVHFHMSGICSNLVVLLGKLAAARNVPPTGLCHPARYRAGHANICKSTPTFTKGKPKMNSDPKEQNISTGYG